ncbi:MAG: hypothetical protein ABSH15_10390 [Verrucomicrobiota bacterium]
MSTATLVQETLSLEGSNPCQFLVLYEDAAAHDLAMEVCGGVMARFDVELAFAFSFWKVKDLNDPVSAHWAAEAVARADIILFSLPGRDLTPEISHWLDACAQVRTKAEGALALIITEPPVAGLAVESLLSRLQYAAHQLRMDFLPLLPPLPDTGIEASAAPWPAGRNDFREEPGGNHWGLNE